MDTQILDFWVGHFNSEEELERFADEDEQFYLEEDSDDVYVSRFAESQETIWFDQDLIEYGFAEGDYNLYEKFSGYSFADEWLPALVQKINDVNLKFDINSLIFVSQGQIPKPSSVETDDFSLVYLGGIEIEY
ncbi:immunity 22 family protein [Chryseobacterium sp.]|uniref:immunity 22 family protein n=1 Tax=Chryseobacterium sp. TaxID=1871047 RepID=UPI00289F271D|nr:immunity 22 family protein [Chryseobacterium sp.]